jgi:hypothetical protein
MNYIQIRITLCIESPKGELVSPILFTIKGESYGAVCDAINKCQELEKWEVLSPNEALKIVEEAVKNVLEDVKLTQG